MLYQFTHAKALNYATNHSICNEGCAYFLSKREYLQFSLDWSRERVTGTSQESGPWIRLSSALTRVN